MGWIEGLETVLHCVVQVCIVLMELFGVIVLVRTSVSCIWRWITKKGGHIALDLARGIALALEFKLGGEVLRTVVVRSWKEIGVLGSIILLRGLITLLIHWEIKNERRELAAEQEG